MEEPKNNPSEEKPKHQWQATKERWYAKLDKMVNLTTKKLDIVIAVCLIGLVLTFVIGYMTRGYTVQFNTLGGTTIESIDCDYGDLVEVDEVPTREGYVFAGWYSDSLLEKEWNLETDIVEGDMTLYASWEEAK